MKLFKVLYFKEVCRNGCNISKAASVLHVTQPSISNAIKDLESQFGVALFQRLSNRLVITKEGEYFLELVNSLLDQSDEIYQKMINIGIRKQPIKLGIPPMTSALLFPKIFSRFTELCPDIKINAFEHGDMANHVKNEEIDLAFVVTNGLDLRPFHTKSILKTNLRLFINKEHKFSQRKSLSLNDIKDIPLVLFHDLRVVKHFNQYGLTPNVILYTNQLSTMINFIENNIAGAFLFKEFSDLEKDIIGIPIENAQEICIDLVWKKNRYLNNSIHSFIKFMQDENKSI